MKKLLADYPTYTFVVALMGVIALYGAAEVADSLIEGIGIFLLFWGGLVLVFVAILLFAPRKY